MANYPRSVYSRLFVADFIDPTITLAVYFTPGIPTVDKLLFTEVSTATLVINPLWPRLSDTIHVTETLVKVKGNPRAEGVSVKESISIGLSLARPILDQLTFVERFSYTLNGYANTPIVTQAASLKLDCSGHAQLILRAPIFGDTEKLQFTRIGRNTRGNDLRVYKDDAWPTTDVFHFEFEYLSPDQATHLLAFTKATLGQTIQITDYNSRVWHGYIITPDESIIQPKVHGFSAKFDFQNKIDS